MIQSRVASLSTDGSTSGLVEVVVAVLAPKTRHLAVAPSRPTPVLAAGRRPANDAERACLHDVQAV